MKPSITFHSDHLQPKDYEPLKPDARKDAEPKPKAVLHRLITVPAGRSFTLFQKGLGRSEKVAIQICTAADPDAAGADDFQDVIQQGALLALHNDRTVIQLATPGSYRLVIPFDARRKQPLIIGMY